MELMSSLESSKSVSSHDGTSSSTATTGRKSLAQGDHSLRRGEEEADNTIARKKRRVTFNPYQERNDFDWQEPTLSIKPSGEAELVTVGSNSSSEDSSNMSLDSDDSNVQSDDTGEASMEMTEAYNGGTYRSDMQSDITDSTMDMTQAYGGVLDATRTILPSGEEEDDVTSASEGEESMSIDQSPRRDDDGYETVTMQFTSVYDSNNEDSVSRVEDEDTEDAEVDMQLTEIAEEGEEEAMTTTEEQPQRDDDNDDSSAMELTATFSPEKSAITARSSMHSPSTPRRSPRYSMPHSSSPKKGHEHCHIPAAESPKQHLSAATQKATARRQSLNQGQSPVKKATSPVKRPSLGTALKKSPAKASTAKPSIPEKTFDSRKSLPAKKEDAAPAPPVLNRRSSSPMKVPTTPSRVWQSFRKSYGQASPDKASASEPQSPTRTSLGSPQRIKVKPSKAAMEAAERAKAELQSQAEEKVTMKQFFDSLNLGFLDITMPSKRRVQRESPIKEEEAELTESIKAACGSVPSLDSLMDACIELKNTVDEGRTTALNYAQEFYEKPPSYVAELKSTKSESERQRIISAFKLQKAAARAIALQSYYAWRVEKQFDDDAVQKWQSIRQKLEADVQYVHTKAHTVKEEAIPALRKRHHEVKEEVARERKRQKQMKEGEAEELGELQRLIDEQGQMLAEQQRVHEASKSELASIQSEVQSNAKKTRKLEEAIAEDTRDYQAIQKCTQEEASRLARHIQQLEQLHLLRIHSASVDRIVVEVEDSIVLTLNLCGKSVSRVDVVADGDAVIQSVLQEAVQKYLATVQADTAQPADVVRLVGTIWTRLQHLTGIYNTLQAHYPTDMSLVKGDHGEREMLIRASVLLSQQRSKLAIEIRSRLSRLADVRSPLFELGDITARCVYGPVGSSLAMQITNGLNTDTGAADFVGVISQVVDAHA